MTLSKSLDRLVSASEYPSGYPLTRWGQLIRESKTLQDAISGLAASDTIVPLQTLGKIKGGAVTRANAFFLVRELSFDEIPARMRVTRADLKRIAVVADGLEFYSKIERKYLKEVVKGPESLKSAFAAERSALRLIDVKEGKEVLKKQHANGALAYLRRGETVDFKTSDDDLKGGVPALRAQVKNRRPYWYSLQGLQNSCARIIFPEHIGRRYVFTLLNSKDDRIVIDKLYLFEPEDEADVAFVHVCLNSLLTWYQIELRGRSQLGQGVLELKIPDYGGILVACPSRLPTKAKEKVLTAYSKIQNPGLLPSFQELGTAPRLEFDTAYLKVCGFEHPEDVAIRLGEELRALAGERTERRLSVADAKISRRKLTNVAASIDAYAARLATAIEPHPDPRTYLPNGAVYEQIPILAPVEGPIEIGTELFNQGEVTAAGTCVARAGSVLAAQFVRGVLLIEPDLEQVNVPLSTALEKAVEAWHRQCQIWQNEFAAAVEHVLAGLDDKRTREAVQSRALKLLHAI